MADIPGRAGQYRHRRSARTTARAASSNDRRFGIPGSLHGRSLPNDPGKQRSACRFAAARNSAASGERRGPEPTLHPTGRVRQRAMTRRRQIRSARGKRQAPHRGQAPTCAGRDVRLIRGRSPRLKRWRRSRLPRAGRVGGGAFENLQLHAAALADRRAGVAAAGLPACCSPCSAASRRWSSLAFRSR